MLRWPFGSTIFVIKYERVKNALPTKLTQVITTIGETPRHRAPKTKIIVYRQI